MKTKIGQLGSVEDTIGTRDAVHVPVVLVKSHQNLVAGQNVRFLDDTYTKVEMCPVSKRHAIVDPFLSKILANEGTYSFLVMLVPDAVTKLVHHYELNFPDVPKIEPEPDKYDEDDGCRGCY